MKSKKYLEQWLKETKQHLKQADKTAIDEQEHQILQITEEVLECVLSDE